MLRVDLDRDFHQPKVVRLDVIDSVVSGVSESGIASAAQCSMALPVDDLFTSAGTKLHFGGPAELMGSP